MGVAATREGARQAEENGGVVDPKEFYHNLEQTYRRMRLEEPKNISLALTHYLTHYLGTGHITQNYRNLA